jgi:hypothetical protein
MKVVINGHEFDPTDDEAVARFCMEREKARMSMIQDAELTPILKEQATGTAFVAVKFAALCALLKSNPETPIDIDLMFQLCDALGDVAGFKFNFSVQEEETTDGQG